LSSKEPFDLTQPRRTKEERAVVRQRAVKKAFSLPSRVCVGRHWEGVYMSIYVAYPEECSGGGRSRPLLLLKLLPRMSWGGPGQRSSRVPMAEGDVPRDGGEKGPVVVERGEAEKGRRGRGRRGEMGGQDTDALKLSSPKD
jgi:hypothetical protein